MAGKSWWLGAMQCEDGYIVKYERIHMCESEESRALVQYKDDILPV